ncbi:hypothetical protein Tco_0455242 [Tanacetum coccineum]
MGLAKDSSSSPIGKAIFLVSNWKWDIYQGGFSLDSKVSDIVSQGEWAWPTDWQVKYPSLAAIDIPILS